MNFNAGQPMPDTGNLQSYAADRETGTMSPDAAMEPDVTLAGTSLECRLRVRITAADAYNVDISRMLCQAWAHLHPGSGAYLQRLHLLLHEAFSNALLHGSLEVSGFDRTSLDDLKRQECEIQERLVRQHFAQRAITVELARFDQSTIVAVEDEGPGYDDSAVLETSRGRGMHLIHEMSESVSLSNGGRRIAIVVGIRPEA